MAHYLKFVICAISFFSLLHFAVAMDLDERKKATDKQLDTHNYLNTCLNETSPYLGKQIEKLDKGDNRAIWTTQEIEQFKETNSQGNKAKHNWDNTYSYPGLSYGGQYYSSSPSVFHQQPYSSTPSSSYQHSGGYQTNSSNLMDDCRRIHQRDTGRDFDRDLDENCTLQ